MIGRPQSIRGRTCLGDRETTDPGFRWGVFFSAYRPEPSQAKPCSDSKGDERDRLWRLRALDESETHRAGSRAGECEREWDRPRGWGWLSGYPARRSGAAFQNGQCGKTPPSGLGLNRTELIIRSRVSVVHHLGNVSTPQHHQIQPALSASVSTRQRQRLGPVDGRSVSAV